MPAVRLETFDDLREIIAVRGISGDKLGTPAGVCDSLNGKFATLLAATDNDRMGPGSGQRVAECPSQHARPADDDGRLVRESEQLMEVRLGR